MKTVIHYFTGTGNTLIIARDFNAGLETAKRVPLLAGGAGRDSVRTGRRKKGSINLFVRGRDHGR